MDGEIAGLLKELDDVSREVRAVKNKQIFVDSILEKLGSASGFYFSRVVPNLNGIQGIDRELREAEDTFKNIHAISRRNCSKQKCLALLKAARHVLVRLEGATLAGASAAALTAHTKADDLIIETLKDVCPTAGLSYEQALRDLDTKERLSWRGPATDLREALRETLDTLAPDKEVEAMSGYKPEPDAKHPTMKQKVRFILRKRGYGSGQLAVPESAIEGVEEIIGGIVRSVYTRSSVSTHVVTSREEVLRVHAWVRITLCELLELPL